MKQADIVQRLLEVKRAAGMDYAGFQRMAGSLPASEDDVTQFVRERTEQYRQRWIITPLLAIIDEISAGLI